MSSGRALDKLCGVVTSTVLQRRTAIRVHEAMLSIGILLQIALALDGPSASASAADVSELASPYYEIRGAAQRRLLAQRFEDGQAIAKDLLTRDDPKLRLAGVEWYREQLRLPKPRAVDVAAFEAALARETDATVRNRAFHVAAEIGPVVESLKQSAKEGKFPRRDLDLVLDARLVRLCEQVMLDGGVPGFFDGQFAAMHSLDSSSLARIARWAWEPKSHPVLRELMIMALHEPRPKELEQLLAPLLMSAEAEVKLMSPRSWPRGRPETNEEIRWVLRAEYSQYARFSLAKAGISEAIDEKIKELQNDFDDQMDKVKRYHLADKKPPDLFVEEAFDTLFKVGYHHQQLDRYTEAEKVYRQITNYREPVSARIWAYYNIACIRAIQGRNDEAIAEFARAIDAGFNDLRWAARDGDLKSLRDDPRFQRMLASLPPNGGSPPPR